MDSDTITRGRYRFVQREDGAMAVVTTAGVAIDVAFPRDPAVAGHTLGEFADAWMAEWAD
jgi:hypothetical protein